MLNVKSNVSQNTKSVSRHAKLTCLAAMIIYPLLCSDGKSQTNEITNFLTLFPTATNPAGYTGTQTTYSSGILDIYGGSPGSAESNSFTLQAGKSYTLAYTFATNSNSVYANQGKVTLWDAGFITSVDLVRPQHATTSGLTFTAAQLSSLAGQTVILEFGNDDTGYHQTFTNIFFGYLQTGPDAANTLIALTNNSHRVRDALTQRAAAITNTMDYDCRDFSTQNICVSFQARYTGFDSMSDGAGVMTAAYRFNPNMRVGAFIDQRSAQGKKTGIDYSGDMPTVGAFIGYTQQPNNTGLQAKLAVSGNTGNITANRDASLANTEAGSGKSSLNSWAVGAELGWGMIVGNSHIATPYMGLRYSDVTRGSYTESTTTDVTSPLSYNGYFQRQTTATAGVRFAGQLTDTLSYQVGLGGEYDVGRSANHYSGTSAISGLETFSVNTNTTSNRLRGNASAGLAYAIDKNQKITVSTSVRNQAYSSQPSVTTMAGYQVSF